MKPLTNKLKSKPLRFTDVNKLVLERRPTLGDLYRHGGTLWIIIDEIELMGMYLSRQGVKIKVQRYEIRDSEKPRSHSRTVILKFVGE